MATKRCAHCRTRFEPKPGHRFCSLDCLRAYEHERRKRTCIACGRRFIQTGTFGKVCSFDCERTLTDRPDHLPPPRIPKSRRRNRLRRNRPAHWSSESTWKKGRAKACALCGDRSRLTQHHVVYRQHVISHGGDPYDPANSMTLCFACHDRHHNGGPWRIAVSSLTEGHLDFAAQLMGPATLHYWPRHYDDDAPDLVEAALARAA